MSLTRPEQEIVLQLVAMGFSESQASTAALSTYNTGIESAVTWLTERGTAEQTFQTRLEASGAGEGQPSSSGAEHAILSWPASEPVVGVPSDVPVVVHPDGNHAPAMVVGVGCECKMVLVVAMDLGMGVGKVAAQCAHAATGLYKVMVSKNLPWLASWEACGEKTVVVSANDSAALDKLAAHAESLRIPTFLVEDAGRTEVAPGSKTVLALAGMSELVDAITGKLRLLK